MESPAILRLKLIILGLHGLEGIYFTVVVVTHDELISSMCELALMTKSTVAASIFGPVPAHLALVQHGYLNEAAASFPRQSLAESQSSTLTTTLLCFGRSHC